MLFPKGNVLVTRSVKKHTYAEAEVTEKFPKRLGGSSVCIYDLNPFLSVVTQFDKPVLDFNEDDAYVKISDESGGLAVKYHYGDESVAYAPDPKRRIELPSTEVEFELTEAAFKSMTNMARILGTPELALESDGDTLSLVALDTKNTSTNLTKLPIGEAPDAEFTFVWKIEYMKLIPGTYNVAVSKEGISRFKHKDMKLTYHILLDANASKYNG